MGDTKYLDKTVVSFKNLLKGARAEAIASNKRFKFAFKYFKWSRISYYEEYPSGLTNCLKKPLIILFKSKH